MNDLYNETMQSINDRNNKIKVTSAEIVVHGTVEKPYYEIKYYDISDGEYHIGYSSYNLNYVHKWLEECFDVVTPVQIENSKEEMIQRIKDCGQYIIDNAATILGDEKYTKELYVTCNFFDRSKPICITVHRNVFY